MKCRHCGAPVHRAFLDLGFAPLANAYLGRDDLSRPEAYYPLRLKVCERCWLVQTEDYAAARQIFSTDYAYFSATSSSWLAHARRYCEEMRPQLGLHGESRVIEIGSNDGYLLRNFVEAGIPCLGIEPTASTAAAAERLGIPVVREFFGEALAARLAGEGRRADLLIGNNVYAHVPDINDFTRGLKRALKPGGTVTLEFPHLQRLIERCQFDTVYHEHFSYLSLFTARRIFETAGLRLFDVAELPTHGGSVRVYGCHADDGRRETPRLAEALRSERDFGLQSAAPYAGFQQRAEALKNALVRFLIGQKEAGRKVAAYGAAAKGNTLLNYAGIKPDLLAYVCDAAPSKQGRFLPGSHIPVLPPAVLDDHRPDVLLILPWNIAPEVVAEQAQVRRWGGRFVVAVPQLRTLE